MKQRLDNVADRDAILTRLNALTSVSKRQWGRMTPHQAVCHLSDSYRSMMTPVPISSRSNVFTRTVVKWIALHTGMKWPHGVQTMPEVDQEIGGTKPVEFERDRQQLESLMREFATRTAGDLQSHPIFGKLTTEEWQHWGWRHADHHFRQFGV